MQYISSDRVSLSFLDISILHNLCPLITMYIQCSIAPVEKAKRIQELMTTSWRRSQKSQPKRTNSMTAIGHASEESKSGERTVTYYHDKAKGIMGCPHYSKKACVSAPCCNEFFPCRFCHDELCDHKINRYEIDRFGCMVCDTVQPVGPECIKCSTKFARYFCEHCRFLDDDPDKSIYHCPDCNLCRIGRGLGIDYL